MAGHAGQSEAWSKNKRKLIILAGWQSGKTDYLVRWCLRQMKRKGPGEAVVAAPSHPLLLVAMQPRLVRAVESMGIGTHHKGDNYIHVPYDSLRRCGYEGDEKGDLTVFFKHTMDAKSVEAVTANWFAGDEAGQMSDEVLEAVEGRVSGTGGDVCLISRPYFDNKFRQLAENPDYETDVVSFASWDNPGWRADLRSIPGALAQEIERLRRSMPEWRFLMKYGGKFTRPAGAIIDNWKDEYEYQHFQIDPAWKRYTFHDFGQVHAFVVCVAEHPTEKDSAGYPVLYAYREYFPNRAISTEDLVGEIRSKETADFLEWTARTDDPLQKWQPRGIGGNKTNEEGWRESYTYAGLTIEAPRVLGVEAQIDALYACVGRGGLRISKECVNLLSMLKAWSWEIDDGGEPIPGKIKDDAKFHGPAALRYGISQLRPNRTEEEDLDTGPPEGSQAWLRLQIGA